MLSFYLNIDDPDVLKIDCDLKGVNNLIKVLIEYRDSEMDHIHLSSPFAGGKDLDEKNPWNGPALSEVVVTIHR